ncbi:MAG: hypothetical protein LWX56_08110 [Ignavibacteria bacterium]|nr:hypothetical protein [Ignavibacteria bacterium]
MTDTQIIEFCEAIIQEKGFLYIEAVIRGQRNQKIIEIFMDSKTDLTIDECAEVSRLISERLEAEMPEAANYRLDVSSPGTARPLKFIEQFPKHIGRNMELELAAEDETKKFVGKLTAVQEAELTFVSKKNEEFKILFDSIKSARVLISFS